MNMEFQQEETKETEIFNGKRVVAKLVSLFTLLPSVQQVFRPLGSKLSRFQKIASLAIAFLTPASGFGQGTLTITFDQPPVPSLPSGGGQWLVYSYSEAGMVFSRSPSSIGFYRYSGAGMVFGSPTFPVGQYIQPLGEYGKPTSCESLNGATFGLFSVDLAAYSIVAGAYDFGFVGYKSDGSRVTASFTGSGISFQTFYFGPEWSGLTRVELPDSSSIDDFVLSVPEPGTGALLALGALTFSFWRSKRRKA